jgi:hypothetical protein
MLAVEGQLLMAGLAHQVCILGNNVSVEVKITRNSLMVFSICENIQVIFYEVPHINLPAMGLISVASIEAQLPNESRCEIKYQRTFFSDETYRNHGDLIKECLQDTLNWYSKQSEAKI